jgi:hypothetical protein
MKIKKNRATALTVDGTLFKNIEAARLFEDCWIFFPTSFKIHLWEWNVVILSDRIGAPG